MKSPEQQAEEIVAHSQIYSLSESRDSYLTGAIATALQSKQAELDEAIGALRPFADFHGATQSSEEADHLIIKEWFHADGINTSTITHGHCRQAAAIVEKHKKKETK